MSGNSPAPRRRNAGRHLSQYLAPLLALLIPAAGPTVAQDDERDRVLAVVERLFDAMRERDETALRRVFAPSARLGDSDIEGFVTAVTGGDAYLDEVTFDETVLIDADLAMAWTPYNLFVDGEFHHCGVDLFVMRRIDGDWLITQLDDTRRTAGCDSQRRD